MQEVSDKVIVILVILAVLVSVIGTYAVTQMAYNVNDFKNSQNQMSPEPDTSVGYITLTKIDSAEEIKEEGGFDG